MIVIENGSNTPIPYVRNCDSPIKSSFHHLVIHINRSSISQKIFRKKSVAVFGSCDFIHLGMHNNNCVPVVFLFT